MLPTGTDDLIRRALLEDVGDGDHTALSTIPADARGAARLLVKQDGVLAGVELAEAICAHYEPALRPRILIRTSLRDAWGCWSCSRSWAVCCWQFSSGIEETGCLHATGGN